MDDRYVHIKLTDKQLALVVEAAAFTIKWFEEQVEKAGDDYGGGYIDGWDGNDVAILESTLQELRKVQRSRF